MEFLKMFDRFIKESSDVQDNHSDDLFNQVSDGMDDDVLKNIKELPSELWTPDMVEAYAKYESMMDELDNVEDDDCCGDDIDSSNNNMMNNPSEKDELREDLNKEDYSEMQDYIVRDVFEEEEKEEEED